MLSRQLGEAIRSAYTVRGKAAPHVLLQFAIAVDRLAAGARGTARSGSGAGQDAGTEPRNTRGAPDAGASIQPARTLSVKEAAHTAEVSESYLRRLVREGTLEVRDSQRPGYAIYADSLAAWQERRRRRETDEEAA